MMLMVYVFDHDYDDAHENLYGNADDSNTVLLMNAVNVHIGD